jgi:hypothetical protein
MAMRSYDLCIKEAVDETPLHPLIASTYYKMGSVELKLEHIDKAEWVASPWYTIQILIVTVITLRKP